MGSTIVELADVFFNGRPAPKTASTVRVKLTAKQIEALAAGETLLFLAGDTKLMLIPKRK